MQKPKNFLISEKRCCRNTPSYEITYRLPDSESETLLVCNTCYQIPCFQKSILTKKILK